MMEKPTRKSRAELENERRRIIDEIKAYPTPIPACDAQFNFLLEERARIEQELEGLEPTAISADK